MSEYNVQDAPTEGVTLDGGCACGAVRYRAVGAPITVNNCYCRLCQRQTGSTGVVNAFYEQENVSLLSGNLVEHSVAGGSGEPHIIRRCTDCGTALFSHYARFGRLGVAVRVGTLDDPGALKPNVAIYTASRMPWVSLPDGVPAFEGNYRASDVLPASSIRRFRDLASRQAADSGAAA